jgi:hypothetical protein
MANFVNPIGAGLTQGRTDQGVDYGGSGPLYALGAGTIVNTHNSGWPGMGTFIALKLDSFSGLPSQYIYYAEDITPAVSVGQRVTAGQVIGHATGGSTGIEVGFAAPPGSGSALAHGASGATTYGQDFFNLVKSLGGPGKGASSTPASLTSAGGGIGSDILGWLTGSTGFLSDFADLFKIFHNLISPSFWLRIGAFFIGGALLIFGIYALVKANSDSPLMPQSLPVPVPI